MLFNLWIALVLVVSALAAPTPQLPGNDTIVTENRTNSPDDSATIVTPKPSSDIAASFSSESTNAVITAQPSEVPTITHKPSVGASSSVSSAVFSSDSLSVPQSSPPVVSPSFKPSSLTVQSSSVASSSTPSSTLLSSVDLSSVTSASLSITLSSSSAGATPTTPSSSVLSSSVDSSSVLSASSRITSSASSTSATLTTPSSSASIPSLTVDKAAYLKGHNDVRQQHNVSPLTWSDDLAQTAQSWANRCEFRHSNGELGPFGENLTAGTGIYTAKSAVQRFTDESLNLSSFNHLTQVVWKSTTQLGCGVAVCDKIFDRVATYHVCMYDPVGNVVGKEQLNVQL